MLIAVQTDAMSNTSQSCTIKGYLCWWTCTLLKAFKYFSTSAWHILDREMLMHENMSCKKLQTDNFLSVRMSGKIVLQRRSDCILKSASHITFCPISFKEAVSVQDTIQTYLLGGNACHFWQNHLRSEKDKPLTIYILHIQTTQGPNSVKSNIGSDHTTKAGKVFILCL